ncbi:hypothetical protein C8R46DRAFT_470972 [Mycena filopes]|nr:hypothetical protein C8R46DRAFT_470972 [Mycena filopes]
MPDIPQEITDYIIDCAASQRVKNTRANLAAYSLVCRAWTHRSRTHFFRECRLLLHYYNARAFGRLLRSPICTILPHVRHLTMANNGDCHGTFDDIKAELKLLTGVESLKLSGSSWAAHGAAPRRGFMSSLASVAELEIDCPDVGDFDHAALIICAFPALRRLSVRGCRFGRYQDERHRILRPPFPAYMPPSWLQQDDAALVRPPHLASLSIDAPGMPFILDWLNWASSHHVTRLELSLDAPPSPVQPVTDYLAGLCDSLEYLKLSSLRLDGGHLPDKFDMAKFQQLRELHLHKLQPYDSEALEESLLPIIQSLASNTVLEMVWLDFDSPPPDERGWCSTLDRFFSHADNLPALKAFRLSLPGTPGPAGSEPEFREWFPLTHAKGLLELRLLPIVQRIQGEDEDDEDEGST